MNNNKSRCENKELIDNWKCDKGFIWNPSNCECVCDQLFDVEDNLDHKNCKYRKRLIYKLVEECSENIDGNKMVIKDLFGILVIVNVHVIYYLMLESIQVIKIVSAEKD